MISFLLKTILVLLIIMVVIGFWRTWSIQHSDRAKMFVGGSVPNPNLDGFYDGTVSGMQYAWLGKKFDAVNSKGVNVFDDGFNSRNERYPFITSTGRGLLDKSTDVLKIDYNIKGNPFWLRLFLDEIVQVKPNEYLGKMELRLIPGYSFALLYFELKQPTHERDGF